MKSRRLRWVRYVAHMRENSNVYRVLVESSEGKKPLGRLGHRWDDSIKMALK
jgi:hypothetical protein